MLKIGDRVFRNAVEVRERISELDREHEGEQFPPEAKAEWNKLNEYAAELEARTERIRELGMRQAGDPAYNGASFGPAGRATTAPHIGAARDTGLRAVERMRGHLSAEAGDALTDLVERDRSGADARYLEAVSRPEYERAFWRRVTNPESAQYEMTEQEGKAMRDVASAELERALTVGSGTIPLPATIDPTINLTSDGAINPIRQLATVTQITTSEWHGVTSAGTTAVFAAEATEVADQTPTLAMPVIKAEKAQSWIEFSIEAGMDQPALADELQKILADQKDVLEATMFLTGNGTNQPEGLSTNLAAGSVVTTASTAAFAVADLYATQNPLPARFSPRAQWLSSLTVANLSWQFVAAGSTTAARVWNDDRTMLLGKPWSEWSTMPTALTTGNKILLYGDVASAYRIVDRVGLSVELVPLVLGANRRPTGVRGLYAYWRVGAAIVVDQAMKVTKTL